MAGRRPRVGDEAERVAPAYSKMLADAVDAAGLKRTELKGPDISYQVVWRVLEHQERPSFSAAERVRQAVQDLRPDLHLPPPSVAVESAEHYEWLRIGTDLLHEDPEGFRRLLERIREIADAMQRERRGMHGLASLVAPGGGDDASD